MKINAILALSVAVLVYFGPVSCQEKVLTEQLVPADDFDQEDKTLEKAGVVTEVKELEKEENIVIIDKSGKPVSTVQVLAEEGYQLELPEDREVCLHRVADDENACYEEEPVKESLPKEVAERCAGREVVLLNPTKCDAKSLPTVAAPVSGALDLTAKLRSTWGTCCRWTYTISWRCVSRYCCRRFLGICIRRCCRRYVRQVIWTRRCVSGYTYPYFYY